ncbi:MAG: hypothetical protein ACMXYM_04265 [Candidatus Woesearchaeota archaeon]
MVFGFGVHQSPWLKEAKRTLKQMRERAEADPKPPPDALISQAADDLSRAAKLTEQITHAKSMLLQDDEQRRECIKTYANESQLGALEDEIQETLEIIHASTKTVFEESTTRLVERMHKLSKKLTSATKSTPPPYVTDSITILEQLKRETDPAKEHTLTGRMQKNLEMISAQIEQLDTNRSETTKTNDDDSWMQAEVERERIEHVHAQRTVLEEMRTIIATFLEKRAS